MNVFKEYGKYYDIIYMDKDYEKECDFIEQIFRKYTKNRPKTILDAGCGTGGHAIPLARREYSVVGIDASSVMIDLAREKAKKLGLNMEFYVMDLRDFNLNVKFDACVCMFAVLDYIAENEEILHVLSNIRNHLKQNSLFVFDFWYGPAVLRILPSERIKVMEKDEIRIIRIANPDLDTLRHVCEVNYHMIVIEGHRVVDEVEERHVVRYFFPQEIKHYLWDCGFSFIELCPFLKLGNAPNEDTWNVAAIAKAR